MGHKIIAKYIIQAKISPFLIASGENDNADKTVILLPDGRPYIPGSSIAGVLRQIFADSYSADEKIMRFVWGGKVSGKEYQSHLIIDDLIAIGDTKISIRDGVKINSETGIAVEGSKYDYQIVEPQVCFLFNAEATLREGINENDFERALAIVGKLIQSSELRIGAHTNFGFGKLESESIQIFKFEFPNDSAQWFEFVEAGILPKEWDVWRSSVLDTNHLMNQFRIKAQFRIKTALLTATYAVDPNKPDKSQLKSKGKFVLSGKSIKGAIRHRALKILKTRLSKEVAEERLKNMMGWVNPSNPEEDAIKSRLRIEESIIHQVAHPQEQPRIRINRFEGGAMTNALFSSEAVWQKGNEELQLEFTLNEMKNDEATLLLHLLKDLWTGDLPVGGEKNIGRGILIGKEAEISWKDKTIRFQTSESGKLDFVEGSLEDLKAFN